MNIYFLYGCAVLIANTEFLVLMNNYNPLNGLTWCLA